jgi:hypothetical protein
MMTMTRFKFAGPVSTAFTACALLAAGTSAADAIVKTIRTFQPVTVTPAHVSAQPAAIANNFCNKAGYGVAITHTFIGFEIDNGTASALFEQITCNPNIPRPLVFKRAGDLIIGQ